MGSQRVGHDWATELCGSDGKASACSVGDPGSNPGSGSSLGKGKAPHSSILARKIPWMEEPVGLQSMGSQRVGHKWVTSLSLSQKLKGKHVLFCCVIIRSGLKESLKDCCHNNSEFKKRMSYVTKTKQCIKKVFVPFSSLRALDPFLLEGPGLLINLLKDYLSQYCLPVLVTMT